VDNEGNKATDTMELAFEIDDVRHDLAKWAADKSKSVKNHCASIDGALEATILGKPYWQPTTQIAGWLACIERDLATQKEAGQ